MADDRSNEIPEDLVGTLRPGRRDLEPNANRRRLIESLGACDRGARSEGWQRPSDHIRASTEDGLEFDSAIECPGIAVGLNISVEAARDRGTVVQAGRVIRRRSSTRDLAYENITIEATWCYEITNAVASDPDDFERQSFPVEKIITGRIEPEAIVDTGSAGCSIRRQRDEGDG